MRQGSMGSTAPEGARLERAIVLQLLRDDREPGWPIEELGLEIGTEGPALAQALGRLSGEGVLCLVRERVSASRATRRLDELGLIGI